MKLLFIYYHGCKSTFGKGLIHFQLHWLPTGNVGDVGANALLFTTEVQTLLKCVSEALHNTTYTLLLYSGFFPYLSEILGVLMCSANSGARPLLSKSNLSRRERGAEPQEKNKKQKTGCLANGCLEKPENTLLSLRANFTGIFRKNCLKTRTYIWIWIYLSVADFIPLLIIYVLS